MKKFLYIAFQNIRYYTSILLLCCLIACDESESSICEETFEINDILTPTISHVTGTSTFRFRSYGVENKNICPTESVSLYAALLGFDGTFDAVPSSVKLYWESDLGWIKWKDNINLVRESPTSNIWEARVDLGSLSFLGIDSDHPANLKAHLVVELVVPWSISEVATWYNKEFKDHQVIMFGTWYRF